MNLRGRARSCHPPRRSSIHLSQCTAYSVYAWSVFLKDSASDRTTYVKDSIGRCREPVEATPRITALLSPDLVGPNPRIFPYNRVGDCTIGQDWTANCAAFWPMASLSVLRRDCISFFVHKFTTSHTRSVCVPYRERELAQRLPDAWARWL